MLKNQSLVKVFHKCIKVFLPPGVRKSVLQKLTFVISDFKVFAKYNFLKLVKFDFLNFAKIDSLSLINLDFLD